jgi:hypothetical protein
VLTDHPPDRDTGIEGSGRPFRWLAFGRPSPNIAITDAHRRTSLQHDTLHVEISNLSDQPARCILSTRPVPGLTEPLVLEPAESRHIVLELPQGHGAVTLVLEPEAGLPTASRPPQPAIDILPDDNRVELLPSPPRTVRVEMDLVHGRLRASLEQALRATEGVVLDQSGPDLVLTDRGGRGPSGGSWVVRFIVEPDTAAFVGPFVMHSSHPLSQGVRLDGAVWSAGRSPELTGGPLLLAGNVVLMSDHEDGLGRHLVRWRLDPLRSTLTSLPAWPILIDNLIRWRRAHLDGPRVVNLRTGDLLEIHAGPSIQHVRVTSPRRSSSSLAVRSGTTYLHAELAGRYRLAVGDEHSEVVANLIGIDESDLRGCDSGSWGSWRQVSTGTSTTDQDLLRRGLAWLAGLAALALLALHRMIQVRPRETETVPWS